jgi:hypothetical protein
MPLAQKRLVSLKADDPRGQAATCNVSRLKGMLGLSETRDAAADRVARGFFSTGTAG